MTSGRSYPYDPSKRITFGDKSITIYAWPSRGGVIVLDDAEAMDLEFLGLNPLVPPSTRDEDQAAEDNFSQRLLLLGAKWWDSEARYVFVCEVQGAAEGYRGTNMENSDRSTRPPPTMREKRYVKVGWPSSGGFWVSEFDTTWAGVDEEEDLPPQEGLARVRMARTMDERCQILKDVFRGKFYQSLGDYEGYAFLNAWEWKQTGEAERSLLTPDETFEEWRRRR